MALVHRNIAANLIGRVWAAVIPLVLVPLYIRFLGIEAYGLIGLFATLQSLCSLLDLGLGVTLTREIARASARGDAGGARNLVRTLETVYWSAALVLGGVVVAMAPTIATHWVHARAISPTEIRMAVVAMGAAIALQFPLALYSGGLNGLERQVALNGITAVFATIRGAGAILVLALVSPTLHAFFLWQIAVAPVPTLAAAWTLWRFLPRAAVRPRFDATVLRRIWRFSLSVSGIGIAATVLTQMDKVLVSKLMPLETFGYYALAGSVAIGLYTVVSPISTAVFPVLAQSVALGHGDRLRRSYHAACQLVSVVALPLALTIAFFASDVLRIWTRNEMVAAHAHLVLSILILSVALNSLIQVPFALQLAHGWTKLGLYQNFIAVVVLVPFMAWATLHFGIAGAASSWVVLNAAYTLVSMPIMHRRLLRSELVAWYARDVALPLAGALFVVLPARLLVLGPLTGIRGAGVLAAVVSTGTLLSAFAAPEPRRWLVERARAALAFAGGGRITAPESSGRA